MSLAADSLGQLTLIAGAALLYFAGRAGVAALAGDDALPGRRAMGHWLPIVAVAAVAVMRREADLALAVIFATSVAAVSLVGGCVGLMDIAGNEPPTWPDRTRKTAGLLLPAAVLNLLAGFSGRIDWVIALVLLAEGGALWSVWLDPADCPTSAMPVRRVSKKHLVLAAVLGLIGAWTAILGVLLVSANMEMPPSAIIAATGLSPLLVAPMLMNATGLAQRGQSWAASASSVGLAQLNLCVLLPLTALAWRIRWHESLIYPLANWRVDAVVLVLLAAALLPSAAGRWRFGKIEGGAMLALYIGYVLAVIAVAIRS